MQEGAQERKVEGEPAFCFMMVVWGKLFRHYFTDYCLPSLLAPNNIPCIVNKQDSKFAIVTTHEDWAELNKHEVFNRLRAHIEPVFIEIPSFSEKEVADSGHRKMLVMSSGHKKLSNFAFENGSCGVNINPDSIYSDYTVHALQESARRGIKMVLYPGVRFEFEGVVDELKERGLLDDPNTITVSPRVAAGIGIRNPHPFTTACHWDNDCFFEYPVYSCITDRVNSLMVVHSISMGPIMLDYRAIDIHRDEIFEKWTLDGDYAHSNFGHFNIENEIEYVDDTDTFMVLGFTPKAEDSTPKVPVRGGRLLRDFYKGMQLWRVYSDSITDPLKKRLYLRQVVFHEFDLGEAWQRLANRDRKIIAKYVVAAISDQDILAYDRKYGLFGGIPLKRTANPFPAKFGSGFRMRFAKVLFSFNHFLVRSAQRLAYIYLRLDFYRRHYSAQGPAHVRYYYYRLSFFAKHFAIKGLALIRYFYYRLSFIVRHSSIQGLARVWARSEQRRSNIVQRLGRVRSHVRRLIRL